MADLLVQETQGQVMNLMQLQSVAFKGGHHQIVNEETKNFFTACVREDIHCCTRSMNKPRLSEALIFTNGLNDSL